MVNGISIADLLNEIYSTCNETGQSKSQSFHLYIEARDQHLDNNNINRFYHEHGTHEYLSLLTEAHEVALSKCRDYMLGFKDM